jgi:hypothetical protein
MSHWACRFSFVTPTAKEEITNAVTTDSGPPMAAPTLPTTTVPNPPETPIAAPPILVAASAFSLVSGKSNTLRCKELPSSRRGLNQHRWGVRLLKCSRAE